VRKTWLAMMGAAALVSGVVAAGPALARLNDSAPAAPGAAAAAPTEVKPVAADRRSWAGTKQFMQVESAQARGGVVTLKVRPAKKETLGESFETKPIAGPYVAVTVQKNARILLLDGESGTPETFAGALGKRTARQRGEAFDITFAADGKVTLVEWLYVS